MRDTIELAREAGAIHIHEKPKEFALVGNDSIKNFEALVRADERSVEREACAKLIEAETGMNPDWQKHLAASIRARGNT
jgi:hypothetical protein